MKIEKEISFYGFSGTALIPLSRKPTLEATNAKYEFAFQVWQISSGYQIFVLPGKGGGRFNLFVKGAVKREFLETVLKEFVSFLRAFS